MLTKHGCSPLIRRGQHSTGVALIVTLSLLVLVTVAVVAFFTRTTANQQITSGSAQSILTETFANGATDEIIGNLQKEMSAVSGYSVLPQPAPSPAVFPMTSVSGSIPSRVISSTDLVFPSGTPDPNAKPSQFANLVKQSLYKQPIYSGGPANAVVSQPASNIPTNTAAIGGRLHDGVYWDQAQLVSVPVSDTVTLNKYLVPNWIYTNRSNSAPNDPNDPAKRHPTLYTPNSGMEPSGNGVLGPNTVVGRYAYNIYDIGGLLNANVAGYGPLNSRSGNDSTLAPVYTDNGTLIVPGYKGSTMMADLSGLALGGGLTTNGANANTFSSGGWQNTLPSFRYKQNWSTDFAEVFASGQYGGWLQPFLMPLYPATATGGAPTTTDKPLAIIPSRQVEFSG